MHLEELELEEFRLYRRAALSFDRSGVALVGGNASGKSTIVEAIALLSTMRSPRTSSDRELINWESGRELGFPPYARARGIATDDQQRRDVAIGLQLEAGADGPLRKSIKVDGQPRRAIDGVGVIRSVLFAPEDVALVSGSPSLRRRYLDLMLSQVEPGYVRALARYLRILEQRNSLLRRLSREGGALPNESDAQLAFWDAELIVYGATIVAARSSALVALGRLATARFEPFGDGRGLGLTYAPSCCGEVLANIDDDSPEAVRSRIGASLQDALARSRRDELRRGVTLHGPHRDDLQLTLDGNDVGIFGSRGQQRLVVVAMKLAEADLIDERTSDRPIVLLDDVLSELDVANRTRLLEALSAAGDQLVVTAADPHLVSGSLLADLPRVTVAAGVLIPV